MSDALISINYGVFCYSVVPLATTEPQERKNPTSGRFGGGARARWVPFGVLTGILFLVSAPDQYLYNPAFQIKITLMGIAGLNVAFFYCFVFGPAKAIPSDADIPLSAKFAAALSLTCWIGVIVCGRLITYYRPPYHWCFWC